MVPAVAMRGGGVDDGIPGRTAGLRGAGMAVVPPVRVADSGGSLMFVDIPPIAAQPCRHGAGMKTAPGVAGVTA